MVINRRSPWSSAAVGKKKRRTDAHYRLRGSGRFCRKRYQLGVVCCNIVILLDDAGQV